MIVYGPRGNGKTALLRYLEKETLKKEGSKLVIQWETPGEMETLEELIVCLIADNKKIWEMIETTDLTVGGPFVKSKTTLNMRRPPPAIKKIIRERCKEKPLILIIDEAHTLNPEVGYALLNASQMVSAEGYPFSAGTGRHAKLKGNAGKGQCFILGAWRKTIPGTIVA